MRLEAYIRKIIFTYPSLFKDVNYEKSRIKVLGHIFWTIGNGLEIAYTKDKSKGGYVTHDTYYRKGGEWTRRYDKPYGREKFIELPKWFFNTKLTEEYELTKGMSNIADKTHPTIDLESTHSYRPYPFSTKYSIGCKVLEGEIVLQEDWRNGLQDLIEETWKYFNDKERYKKDSYYPNEGYINRTTFSFSQGKEKGGVRKLRESWGYEPSDEVPTREEIIQKGEKTWKKYRERKIAYLQKFINT